MRRKRPSSDDAEALDALRVLAGFHCAHCGRELNREKKQFTCSVCQQVHCPICERAARERCAHLLAYSADSRFTFTTVLKPGDQPPSLPLAPGALLQYTVGQKRTAFRTAQKLVTRLYGSRLDAQPSKGVWGNRLAGAVATGSGQYGKWDGGKNRYGQHFFARDRGAAQEQARQFAQQIRDGFEYLRTCQPPAAQYIEQTLSPPDHAQSAESRAANADEFDEDSEEDRGRLCFAPGPTPYLARSQGADIWIWNRSEDAPPRHLPHPAGDVVQSLTFSPDGRQLVVHSEPPNNWNNERGTIHLWNMADARLLARQPWPAPEESSPADSRVGGFLHGGQTLLLIHKATVHLVPLAPASATVGDDPSPFPTGLKLEHRASVGQVAIAPDGETFATMQGRFVIVWRVGRDDIRAVRPVPQNQGSAEGK